MEVEAMVGSSGLQLKVDPGIPLVYGGFAMIILSTFLSVLPFNQIWAVVEGDTLHVGGATNRAEEEFKRDFSRVLDAVPDIGE